MPILTWGRVEDALSSRGSAVAIGLIAAVWGLLPLHGYAALVHQWTFEDGTQDVVGSANGTLFGDAYIQNGKLWLDGTGDYMRAAATGETMTQKTLVAWVELNNLTQRGSGIVSQAEATDIGSPNFDAIVFGERVAKQWENGSQNFDRTPTNNGGALETSTYLRMLAIAYESDSSIRIYRDGAAYATVNPAGNLWNISNSDLWYQVGARAYGAGTLYGFLDGAVEEVQVYNTALGASDVSTLYAQGPAPVPEPKGLALVAALTTGVTHLAGRWLRRTSSRTPPAAA